MYIMCIYIYIIYNVFVRSWSVLVMHIYIYTPSPYQTPNFTFVAFLVRPLPARDDLGSWVLNGLSEFEFAMMHVYLIA